jgi:hypothetical protein
MGLLRWSPWASFDITLFSALSGGSGVYRVHVVGHQSRACIGQTGTLTCIHFEPMAMANKITQEYRAVALP